MQSAKYYRKEADRADRLSAGVGTRETEELLKRVARDFRDIAVDLEAGAIEITRPALLLQRDHLEG